MKTRLVIAAVVIILLSLACDGGEEGPSQTTPASSPAPQATAAGLPLTGTLPMGEIAFLSRRDGKGEIYLLTSQGEQNISNNEAEDEDPAISPDGTKIAFSSNREGTSHIYVANIDGSDLTRLTHEGAGDFTPEWSPDGKRIAFTRAGSIMVMDSDGRNVQKVKDPKPESTAPPCEAGAFLGGWSPDGKRLTFYAASATTELGQVCIINADGTGLTVVASEPSGYHVEPSWSPNGEWIVYRFIYEGNHEIYKVKPDGSSPTNLTNSPAIDLEPAWSPDSQSIVFSSDREGNLDLHIMKADGSDVARVTSNPAKDSDPSWGP